MTIDLQHEAEILLQSVTIPSPPRLVLEIQNEMNNQEPDYKVLTDLIRQDMAITARMIKMANSPFFGIRYPVDSIQTALSVLGLDNFKQIIVASALKEALNSKEISLKDFEAFYSHSMWVAQAAYLLVKQKSDQLNDLSADHAYLAGLFHNCGMIMLVKKYKAYFKLLRQHVKGTSSLIAFEEKSFRTNHAIIGRFVAGAWELPVQTCKAIIWHHETDLSAIENDSQRQLVATLILAGTLVYHLTHRDYPNMAYYHHFMKQRKGFQTLLKQLGLRLSDYIRVEEKIKEGINI